MQAEAPAVSVLVVDDQEPFRAAARFVVRATAGYQVVGEAASGEAALELAERLRPSLVLMDINLPGMSGIEATRRLTRTLPDVVVMLLSTYSADDLPDDAGTSGARAYVHKTDLTPDVLRSVIDGTQPPGF
ncbi:response regulator transcription factor [Phytoactinopolyspora halotolerans]|uniref:Response regulator transcription factor n=1 Tax=Phytoactinopolyspora halotolerans TaxID=1981512 RepID=A0A6L9S5M1_9ACTN|nr:response regulator transcription factor [Phytoactinopolyspora halotolerans]